MKPVRTCAGKLSLPIGIMRYIFLCLFLCWGTFLRAQVSPEQKCSPALQKLARSLPQTDDRTTEHHLFTLVVADLPAFRQWLQQNGLREHSAYDPAGVIIIADDSRHFLLTTLPRSEVLFADLTTHTAREELPVPGHNLFVNTISYVHNRWPALDGDGSTISIKEFRFDSLDVDLKSRYVPNSQSAQAITGHASIMASLVAGAGTSNPQGRGVARGSRLVSSSFLDLLPDPDADYAALNISVQNHAYGVEVENYYGAGALAYDESTRQHPDLLHVFSSGNQGALSGGTSGTYAHLSGFANLTGNFKMAKNVLLVGAVDSFGQVTPFSSRGPAYDGRIKPDLVAFGYDGTSGAAALVSGSAAVIRQAYFEKYGLYPSAALLRAILIGSADDLGLPGPDFSSGYGNLNLKKAVELVQDQFLAEGVSSQGTQQEFIITIPAQTSQLTITLAWNDVPAAPNAAQSLVNDLDLEVQAPDGSIWQPWQLNAFPHPDSLMRPAKTGRDSVNNLEQVTVPNPAAGAYRVLVKGRILPAGEQSYALAGLSIPLARFTWTYPLRRDPAASGKEAVLRWASTFAAEKGILDWKPAGSSAWQTFDTIQLAAGNQRWNLPDTVTPTQVRMRINGAEFLSDTFLIAPELRMRIGFQCPDSLMLQWPALAPGLHYRVWGLGDKYLAPLFSTLDTTVILQKSAFPQQNFAVSTLNSDETVEGPISGAPDIFTQGAGCYLNNLLAFLNVNQVELTMQLSTISGVNQVFIERWEQSAWVLLFQTAPATLEVDFIDLSPATGVNLYRARVGLNSGGMIIGLPVTIYFAGENGYFVVPNPVHSGDLLTVLTSQTDDVPRFMLFNALGQLVLEKPLDDVRVDLRLPNLPPGYYAWMVVGEVSKKRLQRGKLLINP